jgi:hypothetical protein
LLLLFLFFGEIFFFLKVDFVHLSGKMKEDSKIFNTVNPKEK